MAEMERMLTRLESHSRNIAALRHRLETCAAKARRHIAHQIDVLRGRRDRLRRHAIEATSQEIARLDADEVFAAHAASVADGPAKTYAQATLERIRGARAWYYAALRVHIAAIAYDTDEQINELRTQVAAAAAEWRASKSEFDAEPHDLVPLGANQPPR